MGVEIQLVCFASYTSISGSMIFKSYYTYYPSYQHNWQFWKQQRQTNKSWRRRMRGADGCRSPWPVSACWSWSSIWWHWWWSRTKTHIFSSNGILRLCIYIACTNQSWGAQEYSPDYFFPGFVPKLPKELLVSIFLFLRRGLVAS